MAYILLLGKGRLRADVRTKDIVKHKAIPSKSLAQAWTDKI